MEKTNRLLVNFSRIGKTASYTAIASAVFMASQANAQMLHNLTIGNPKALALGNAVTADPPGIDSIHYNPAGLSKIKGRQYQMKLLVADMTLETEFGEPTLPTDATKLAYYNIRQDNPDDLDCNGPTSTPETCWGVDPISNDSISSGDPVLMLPFAGLVELPILAVPMGGIAFEDSARGWTFGTAVYSPEGVGYTRDADPEEAGSYQGYEVGVTRLTYFSPTVAIEVNDELSIGAGINFSYHGLGINTLFRAPMTTTKFLSDLDTFQGILDISLIGPYDWVSDLSLELEDYMSVGFNFGILWEPYDWLAFGFAYQSESTSHMKGDYKVVNSDKFFATVDSLHHAGLDSILAALSGDSPFNAQKVEEGEVEVEYIMPQNIAFGTSVRVLPDLKINVDLKWIEYSVWDELEFEFDGPVDFLTLASIVNNFAQLDYADSDKMRISRYYDDVWSWSIGGEYQLNDNLVLRAGYEPRGSAIPEDRTDLLLPIGDADLYTVGFGLQLDRTSRVEAAFGYLLSEVSVDPCESLNANSCKDGDVVYNPYYSTAFKNTTTAYLVNLSYDKKF
ncbi:MAG TPA: outer membrane protein transport protein [Dongiaceae bacterium]|nr:outer membrane protein transport protein [Dongiaceae bacterium]